MYLMARAAKQAGAKMIRTSSVCDIVEIKEETGLPVIGLIKREYPGYTGRITMTMREVDECMEAMADIVSIDCTFNERADGLTPPEFLRQVKAKYPNIIFSRAAQGDETMLGVLDRWIGDIAAGVSGLIHIFNPQMVLIGGGVSAQTELLIRPLRERILGCVMPRFAECVRIEAATLGNDAGLLGAAKFFMDCSAEA